MREGDFNVTPPSRPAPAPKIHVLTREQGVVWDWCWCILQHEMGEPHFA